MGDVAMTGGLILNRGISRGMEIWLPGYLKTCLSRLKDCTRAVWLMFADHFEPYWNNDNSTIAAKRVSVWRERWPLIAARHRDTAGRPPRYTFFYPQEEYQPNLLDQLSEMTHQGIADVEVHIHHDGEGEQDFTDRMREFIETLHTSHALLRKRNDQLRFGFIHGNWSLDNSLPNGRLCGLNNEITILRDLGCYADFTLPSAPSPSQVRMVNTIYWATDDPTRPKSHDKGVPVVPGGPVAGDLLLVPGPLGIRWWPSQTRRIMPKLETGELAGHAPPSEDRLRSWLFLAPRLDGNVFLKLHTHGAQEKNAALLLESGLDDVLSGLTLLCAQRGIPLYFVSAWEMYCAINAIRQQLSPLASINTLGDM